MTKTGPRPFLKWAGGKSSLLDQLEALLPADFALQRDITYIEPFVGGGAMLFHMLRHYKNISRVVINDINPDLIHCYRLIKDNPLTLIDRLKTIEQNFYHGDIQDRKELYYAYRDQYNQDKIDSDERAALLMFLNHTCFNGLYRVNSSGKFNVPFGHYKHPVICNEDLILADHKLIKSLRFFTIIGPGDYKSTKNNLGRNKYNFVYLDPPYRPLLNSNNFKEYSNSPFGDKQQEELKVFCDKLGERGCRIMQSNSDSMNADGTSYFEELYEGYNFSRISAPRFINAFQEKREKLNEIVILNY
jgi:DNA adenine methylase